MERDYETKGRVLLRVGFNTVNADDTRNFSLSWVAMVENPDFMSAWNPGGVALAPSPSPLVKKPIEYSGPFCLAPAELGIPF